MLLHLLIFISNFFSIIAQSSAFADKIAAMSKQTEENETDNAVAKAIGVFAPNPENKNKGKRPKKPKNKNKNKNNNSYGGNNYVNRPKSPPKKTKPPKTTRPTYPTYTTRTYGQETTPVAKTYPPTYPPIKRPLGVGSKVSTKIKLRRNLFQCWHCDAPSMEECEKIGVYRTCPHNAQSCMIETRKRNGIMEQVFKTHFPKYSLFTLDRVSI